MASAGSFVFLCSGCLATSSLPVRVRPGISTAIATLTATLTTTATVATSTAFTRYPSSRSWLASTPSRGQARGYATREVRRAPPSRMVLSDRVARPLLKPGDSSQSDRREQGAFGGLNRTVANIREKDARRSRPSPSAGVLQREGGVGRRAGSRGSVTADERFKTKAMKMQQALATVSYRDRSRMKSLASKIESFNDFDLLPVVKEAVEKTVLTGMTDIKPSPVQSLAIPALLGHYKRVLNGGHTPTTPTVAASEGGVVAGHPDRREFLLAAETGSGKTLAYLLPSVNAVKLDEARDESVVAWELRRAEAAAAGVAGFDEPHPNMARPRVVVLVPSAELVEQVGSVAKNLSHIIKFKAAKLSSAATPAAIHRRLYNPNGVDVVVALPHLLASIAASDPNVLSRVTHLVVDEADSLLDRSFAATTADIIDRCTPSLRQLVFCSATIPRRLDTVLTDRWPDAVRVVTPNLHAVPRRVQLGVVDLSNRSATAGVGPMSKDQACADAIWSIGRDGAEHRIIVFVNEREKTEQVARYLVSKGIDAVALNRDTYDARTSDKVLKEFTESKNPSAAESDDDGGDEADGESAAGTSNKWGARRKLANTKVMVATDLASRGIDTLAVRRVILYDVPHTTIDFIHRLGRAGRMGRRGRGIVLVDRHDRKDIVAEVRKLMFAGQALI